MERVGEGVQLCNCAAVHPSQEGRLTFETEATLVYAVAPENSEAPCRLTPTMIRMIRMIRMI